MIETLTVPFKNLQVLTDMYLSEFEDLFPEVDLKGYKDSASFYLEPVTRTIVIFVKYFEWSEGISEGNDEMIYNVGSSVLLTSTNFFSVDQIEAIEFSEPLSTTLSNSNINVFLCYQEARIVYNWYNLHG